MTRVLHVKFNDKSERRIEIPDDAKVSYGTMRDKYNYSYQETHVLQIWKTGTDMTKSSKDMMAVFRDVEDFCESTIKYQLTKQAEQK